MTTERFVLAYRPDYTSGLYVSRRFDTVHSAKVYIGWSDDYERKLEVRLETWQEREDIKLRDGTNLPLVFLNDPAFRNLVTPVACLEHFPHISHINPAHIAYTENAEKGAKGVQNSIKPGRYLSKFYGGLLTEKQIAALAVWHTTGQRAATEYAKATLKYARTADEMTHIYTSGPSSCMSHPMENYKSARAGVHPAAAYAGGDLAVAYLETAEGKIIARALVREGTLTYGRIYPTDYAWPTDGCASIEDSQDRSRALEFKLKALDMVHLHINREGFDGARLNRIECCDGLVMPYFDGDVNFCDDGVETTMQYGGDYTSNRTDGWAECDSHENDWHCQHCEEDYREDDDQHEVVTYISQRGGLNHSTWCDHCIRNNAFCCEGHQERFSDHLGSIEVDGDTYSSHYVESEGDFYVCTEDGEWHQGPAEEIDGDLYHPDSDAVATRDRELAEAIALEDVA